MPACEKCGAHVGEDGKWAPAAQTLALSNERDKAVRDGVELQWVVGGMRGEITKVQLDCEEKNKAMRRAIELLTAKPHSPPGSVAWAAVVEAIDILKGAL